MAESDHTLALNSLSTSSVLVGVTAGNTPPNGGGSHVYGMRSITNSIGAVALYTNLTDFSPTAEGADASIAIKKDGGGGNTSHSPFLFLGLQGTDINGSGYMLGLSSTDPSVLELRKGILLEGLTGDAVGVSGVLARSTNTYAVGTWVHLRLEMVVNTSGDVLLNVYENDLGTNAVTAPSWSVVAGMSGVENGAAATAFIDDALGANSGSVPFTSGRHGFGTAFQDISRAAYFDHYALARQT